MNEKIDEFALQSQKEYGDFDGSITAFDYRKFAQLIIRECIESIQATSVESVALDRTLMENMCLTINDIKTHFGI